ncbi:class I SAM-dependent methyltransferase [Candidatus Kryptonium thompsonii]|uniref:class I SAM-dependent methyltransferase n=1 Tax=Candidatus Kryptonium thompsonii TaxID=1633631 RepID=UPI000707FC91|nr:class I SAM-dependent methyltransferase [Candidatus Kryptonium thompsoni]CUT05639.1 Methyltransferase domain-containing protein [Candidatus Kryptonium thompsoni]
MPENGKFETYGKVKSASDFYDELSEDYMDMIEFSSKVESESEIFKTIVSEYKITRCLDAGCGVGLHSIILSKLGVEVLGIDISASMIEKARELAQRFGVSAEFEVLDFSLIKEKYKEKFELVLCIGNTLPHLINEKDLLIALRNFYNALVPNGILIAQILNYDKIMENEERIVNVRETPERIFVRFYDFEPTIVGSPSLKVFEIRKDFLKFNVLIVDKTKNYSHKLITTRIKPIKSEALCRKLRMVGFKEIEIFGDFLKREFKANESKNIVVFARKT